MNNQSSYIEVTYFPNATTYGTIAARLQWEGSGRITLTTVEGTSENPIYTQLFDLPVGEIKKVKSMIDEIKIYTNSTKYRVSVSPSSQAVLVAGGLPGVVAANAMYRMTNVDELLERFRQGGVAVTRIGYGAFYGIALGGAVLLVAVLFGIFLLVEG